MISYRESGAFLHLKHFIQRKANDSDGYTTTEHVSVSKTRHVTFWWGVVWVSWCQNVNSMTRRTKNKLFLQPHHSAVDSWISSFLFCSQWPFLLRQHEYVRQQELINVHLRIGVRACGTTQGWCSTFYPVVSSCSVTSTSTFDYSPGTVTPHCHFSSPNTWLKRTFASEIISNAFRGQPMLFLVRVCRACPGSYDLALPPS